MLIGEFEVAARAADPDRELDTFIFCGQKFTVEPELNILAIGRFQMAAGDGVDTEDPQALPLMIQTIASCVIEEDEDRFLNLATRRRANPELLLKIGYQVNSRAWRRASSGLISWPMRLVLNAAYAYLAARADDGDRAELGLKPYANEEASRDLCGNREALDQWLNAPLGEQAAQEHAVLEYLTT
jgi:hypothetical protein